MIEVSGLAGFLVDSRCFLDHRSIGVNSRGINIAFRCFAGGRGVWQVSVCVCVYVCVCVFV